MLQFEIFFAPLVSLLILSDSILPISGIPCRVQSATMQAKLNNLILHNSNDTENTELQEILTENRLMQETQKQ